MDSFKYPAGLTGAAALGRTRKERVAQPRQIVGQAGLEAQDFAGFGVLEAQYMGVEGLSAKGRQRFPCAFRQERGLGFEPGTVGMIAQEWMADMGEVDPNLMGAPGLKAA